MHRIALDFASTVPLHHQLSAALRDGIRSGELRHGQRLPSERELFTELGVSRGTVRQAIQNLINEGLVYTERGRGNFVSGRKIDQALLSFPSLILSLRQGSHRMATRPLGVSTLEASLAIASSLSIGQGDPVIEVRRLRLLDGEPFLLTSTTVPEAVCPRLSADDHELRTVYELLERKYAIPIRRVTSSLETTLLSQAEADLLDVPASTPAFRMERVAYSANVPVAHTVHTIRGDRCRFSFELTNQVFEPEAVVAG